MDIDKFVLPAWRENISSIKDYVDRGDFRGFLDTRVFNGTMFAGNQQYVIDELVWLESTGASAVSKTMLSTNEHLPEDRMFPGYPVSGNTIHHAFHIMYYEHVTGQSLSDSQTVVEFGGGYGNFCRLMRMMNGSSTYVIVDLPEMSALQFSYLRSIPGLTVTYAGTEVTSEAVNLVPLDSIEVLERLKADLFISTWALSESTKEAQDYIGGLGYYGAQHALMAFQKSSDHFPFAEDVCSKFEGGQLLDTPFIPNNHYYFL